MAWTRVYNVDVVGVIAVSMVSFVANSNYKHDAVEGILWLTVQSPTSSFIAVPQLVYLM